MNTASTPQLELCWIFESERPILNPFKVKAVADTILSLNYQLEQIRLLVEKGGASKGVMELIREYEIEAIKLKDFLLASAKSVEKILIEASRKVLKDLMKHAKSIASALTEARKVVRKMIENEKQITD